jgi:Secretion system C-terminal sorting domain
METNGFFDGTTWKTYDIWNSDIPVNNISVINFENDSVRWVGTINGGLSKMINDSFYTFNIVNFSLPDNTILGMARDTGNFLWSACPAGGLVRGYGTNFYVFNTATSGNPSNAITSVAIDSLQNIYVGSYDFGLIKKEGINFTSWNTSNSPMPDDIVYCVTIERNGVIWVGTDSHGVVRFDENSWLNNSEINNNVILSVYPNPCKNNLIINWNKKSDGEIKIFDLEGRTVYLNNIDKINSTIAIDVSSFSAGAYFIHIKSGEGNSSRLFIKE